MSRRRAIHALVAMLALQAGAAHVLAAPDTAPATSTAPATAPATAPSWWNEAWPFRARIECPGGDGDVGHITLHLGGRAQNDGRDLRVIDDSGRSVPFELLFHDPLAHTVLSFRATPNQAQRLWIYFGNPKAPAIETAKPDPREHEDALNLWKSAVEKRGQIQQQRLVIEQQIRAAQESLATTAPATSPASQPATRPATAPASLSIAELQKQLDALKLLPEPPKPAPPANWQRTRGVLLRIYRKAQEGNPPNLEAFEQVRSKSTLEGAAFRDNISDGFNPFGPSEHYLSYYEGFLQIAKPGEYGFCTVSDDGSFVHINNQRIVEWPGLHGWGGSERGEKSGTITLPVGAARVIYRHEQAVDNQMAYLGWKPPEGKHFVAIPPAQWLSVRKATLSTFEARTQKILAMPVARVVSTHWLRGPDGKQTTLVEFLDASASSVSKIKRRTWSFGDGVEANGDKLDHVYFRLGRPTVTLTVEDEQGNRDTVTCSPNIYKVDVVTNYYQFGKPEDYAKIAATYDNAKLPREDLFNLAEFWRSLDRRAEHARAVATFINRFPKDGAVGRFAMEVVDSLLHSSNYDAKQADQLLARGIELDNSAVRNLELMLQRAIVLTWELNDTETAAPLIESVYEATRATAEEERVRVLVKRAAERRVHRPAKRLLRERPNAAPEEKLRTLARRSLIAMGDVALLSNEISDAQELYAQARKLDARAIPRAEELAKIGTFPFTVEDLLARGEHDFALQEIDEWEDFFPAEKATGWTQFWRGKVLFVQQPGLRAERYLTLAETINPKGIFVPEALWLRANSMMSRGQYAEALTLLQRIRSDFTATEYFRKAPEKIKECQDKIAKP